LFTLVAGWVAWRKPPFSKHPGLTKVLVLISPLGFVALEAGWMVTELGRQPWIIYHDFLVLKIVGNAASRKMREMFTPAAKHQPRAPRGPENSAVVFLGGMRLTLLLSIVVAGATISKGGQVVLTSDPPEYEVVFSGSV
jgi:hypothetical protein